MGNRFGNYPSQEAVEADLIAEGFKPRGNGIFAKREMSGGNLIEAPRPMVALAKACFCRVDPKWNAPDYWQLEFL